MKSITDFNHSGWSFGLRLLVTVVFIFFISISGMQAQQPVKKQDEKKELVKESSKSSGKKPTKETTKAKKKVPEIEIDLGLATIYDDNILKYSQKYLDRFMSGEDFGRFHIDTYDDIILNPSVKATLGYKLFGKQKSELNVDFTPRYYMVNEIKNWNSFAVGFRQYLPKRFNFKLAYSYLPDFYIRHFRDEDWVKVYGYIPETFMPMSFSKDQYSFFLHKTLFKNTGVRMTLGYSQYFYNSNFTEYDSDDLMFGIRFYQPLHENFKIDVGYEYVYSDAKGYDEPDETAETSDDADADFEEDGFFFSGTWQIPEVRKLKHSLNAGIGFEKRYYLTKNYVELDPEHAGRVDQVLSFDVTYNIRLNKSLDLSAFFKWMGRDSNTSSDINSAYVSAEKDYRQAQVGLEVNYILKYK